MSGGRLMVDVLPSGAVVPPKEIGAAVDKRVVDAGQHWTHYQIGKHPAAGLFSGPPGAVGLGYDQTVWLAWFFEGEGQELYEEFYQEVIGQNIVPFVFGPDGPEMLGWFKEPIETLDEFRAQRWRVSSGLAQDVYREMGATPVSMAGAEIIPAIEKGVLDAGEWINPSTDIKMGFYDVLKYLCLGGLHQADGFCSIIINGDAWSELPADIQTMIEVATKAAFLEHQTYNVTRNAWALEELKTEHGVTVFPAPPGYEEEFTRAVSVVVAKLSAEHPFFKKVMDSQKAFAERVVPYETEVNRLYANMGAATYED
jgi:TRAP-type mannitol/chloroaromatic compound transport system substrate-binding protein